jgi:predicted anti-sigma-YlaC factor YlaD
VSIAVSTMSCARARRALSLTLDGEAAPSLIYTLALHLGQCDSCRQFTAQVGAITRCLRSIRPESNSHHEPTTWKGATS